MSLSVHNNDQKSIENNHISPKLKKKKSQKYPQTPKMDTEKLPK